MACLIVPISNLFVSIHNLEVNKNFHFPEESIDQVLVLVRQQGSPQVSVVPGRSTLMTSFHVHMCGSSRAKLQQGSVLQLIVITVPYSF